jgi:hypothetical protein
MIKWYDVPVEVAQLESLYIQSGGAEFANTIHRRDTDGGFDMVATADAANIDLEFRAISAVSGITGIPSQLHHRGHMTISTSQSRVEQELVTGHEIAHIFLGVHVPKQILAQLSLATEWGSVSRQKGEEFCEYFAHRLTGINLPKLTGQLALFYENRPEPHQPE